MKKSKITHTINSSNISKHTIKKVVNKLKTEPTKLKTKYIMVKGKVIKE